MKGAIRAVTTRPILFVPLASCLAISVIWQPQGHPLMERLLAGWFFAATIFVIAVSIVLGNMPSKAFSTKVDDLDEGAVSILVLSMLAVAASFAGVTFELQAIHAHSASSISLPLMVATIVASWFFIHVMFAIHYAHVYYNDGGHPSPCLDFGGSTDKPDYWDFVYFSVTIGASSATSDTNLHSRQMRRIVAAHAVFSFFFNATVLALAINIAAGLLGGN